MEAMGEVRPEAGLAATAEDMKEVRLVAMAPAVDSWEAAAKVVATGPHTSRRLPSHRNRS